MASCVFMCGKIAGREGVRDMPIETITAMQTSFLLCIAVINGIAIVLMVKDRPYMAWVIWGLAASICMLMSCMKGA